MLETLESSKDPSRFLEPNVFMAKNLKETHRPLRGKMKWISNNLKILIIYFFQNEIQSITDVVHAEESVALPSRTVIERLLVQCWSFHRRNRAWVWLEGKTNKFGISRLSAWVVVNVALWPLLLPTPSHSGCCCCFTSKNLSRQISEKLLKLWARTNL